MPDAKAKIILGETFQISQPYAEGHTLTAAEAKALNQTRAENIGNNMRSLVKEAQDKGDTSELAAKVAEYDARYEFSMGTVGGASRVVRDPVEREARAIARDILKAHLAKNGRKLTLAKDAPQDEKDEWAAQVEEQIDAIAQNEKVINAAKKRVKDKKNLADSLDLGGGEEQREAAE
jgi:hypothetical protein